MGRIIRNTQTEAVHDWPEDVMIQGGGDGIVFAKTGSYNTAFFEAFPAGTFLRGEGETLTAAEESCWQQYQVHIGCEHGPFERRQYTNGAGFCTKCGTWMNRVFEPLPEDPNREPSQLELFFRTMRERWDAEEHDPEDCPKRVDVGTVTDGSGTAWIHGDCQYTATTAQEAST